MISNTFGSEINEVAGGGSGTFSDKSIENFASVGGGAGGGSVTITTGSISFIDKKSVLDSNPMACMSFCGDNDDGMDVPPSDTANWSGLPPMEVDDNDDDGGALSDADMARKLGELSPQERNLLYEDIHGVAPVKDEDPELVTRKLSQLESEIERIRDDKSAYNKALFLGPRLVKSRAFRLMFLRARNFDPREAANNIVQHFRDKERLFGTSKVAKQITLDDLDEDDMEALQSGSEQFLTEPDSSGRGVIVLARKHIKAKTWDNQLRAHWYTHMTNIQNNESIQKNGVVYICYDVDCTLAEGIANMELVKRMAEITKGIPFKLASLQFCYNNPIIKQITVPLRRICGASVSLRARAHFGTHQECQYELMSFGIPINVFPVDIMGELREYFAEGFIDKRRVREQAVQDKETKTNQIDAATDRDILLGRGRPSQNHAGNVQLAKLIEERHASYTKADRFEKLCISWDIVKLVQNDRGGKFLEKDGSSGAWKRVPDDQARDKVAYGFRSVRKLRTCK